MPVGVVVGGALAEVAQPADELGRVRARELEHRLELLRAPGGRRERRRGDALEPRQQLVGVDQVVVGAGAVDQRGCRSRIVGRASCTSGRSSRRNGARSLSRAWTRRPARRGRRASRAGSRTCCWRAAASSAAAPSARAERDVLGGDRAGRRVRVGDQARQVVAALGDRRHRVGGVDDEARSDASSSVSCADQPARGRQRRVEVLGRLVGLRRPCPRTGWRSPG